LADTSDFSANCDECYIYLEAGVGFEFQTESFNIFPSYLVYMKMWVSTIAIYSFDGYMEAKGQVDYHPPDSENVLVNAQGSPQQDVNFGSMNILDLKLVGHTDDEFLWKKTWGVAEIQIAAGIKLPVFSSMTFQSDAAGSASKFSFYYAKEEYGIAYLGYPQECSMDGCQALRNEGCSGWCKISISERRQGGREPSWNFPISSNATATFTFHPVVSICLFISQSSCMLSGFVEPRISVMNQPSAGQRSITSDKTQALASSLLSASRGTNLQGTDSETVHLRSCGMNVRIDLKVKMDIYAWAKAELVFAGTTLATVESGVLTLFTSDYFLLWSGCAKHTPPPATITGSLCGANAPSTPPATDPVGSSSSHLALLALGQGVPAGSKQCSLASGSRRSITDYQYGAHVCIDDDSWTDKDGKGCSYYEKKPKFCSELFVSFYANSDGASAENVCCICRGGTRICQKEGWKVPCLSAYSECGRYIVRRDCLYRSAPSACSHPEPCVSTKGHGWPCTNHDRHCCRVKSLIHTTTRRVPISKWIPCAARHSRLILNGPPSWCALDGVMCFLSFNFSNLPNMMARVCSGRGFLPSPSCATLDFAW